jgi:hypothetical protein
MESVNAGGFGAVAGYDGAGQELLKVEEVRQPRTTSAADTAAARIVAVIPIVVVIVAISTPLNRASLKRFVLYERNQLFELALVEPEAASSGANVEFDAVAVNLAHRSAIDGGCQERHGFSSVRWRLEKGGGPGLA